MQPAESRQILFVLGMHRSGTSALCAALEACGAAFSDDLLRPMHDVNEHGFWESAAVVGINDRLLELAGASWFAVSPSVLQVDWTDAAFDEERAAALAYLSSSVGADTLQVIKDPRLCLTLPLWTAACDEVGVEFSVCKMWREPSEICQSLERRDGFPPGYCMRLLQVYSQGMIAPLAARVFSASYDQLLTEPVQLLRRLSEQLPLTVDEDRLAAALKSQLRHYRVSGDREGGDPKPVTAGFELPDVDIGYPPEDVLREYAARFVARGKELTRIGEAHTVALGIIQQRDEQLAGANDEIERCGAQITDLHAAITERYEELKKANEELHRLGELHTDALSTISTRDTQISEFDTRLCELGEQHSRALATLQERDAQIQELLEASAELTRKYDQLSQEYDRCVQEHENVLRRLKKFRDIPLLGPIIRVMWNRA